MNSRCIGYCLFNGFFASSVLRRESCASFSLHAYYRISQTVSGELGKTLGSAIYSRAAVGSQLSLMNRSEFNFACSRSSLYMAQDLPEFP